MVVRWSVIASQLPGRTDNDVKNYWNTKLKKKLLAGKISLITTNTSSNPIPASTSTTTDHLISGSKPSFQPPILVPNLQTLTENSSLSCPNSQTATLRMLSADINYNVPGLSVYDQRLSFNNSVMDFTDHQFDHVNSKKNRDIINGSLSQEVLSISHSSNSIAPASDHHTLLPEISGCDEYSDGTTTSMDFGFGLSPYDNIVSDVSFEEKAAYNSMSLADHQSIINHY
ncbi:Octamer-binding transcription factor [Parasponia andersonii]|uniref:Octamer-binding transcription factor n=1 Tax=Parasponia andersonii TaxID=3476 RepID=A0A2P5DTN0_PARAD|nr:Octamer-binding transcription factor [Parasponia andersonii]